MLEGRTNQRAKNNRNNQERRTLEIIWKKEKEEGTFGREELPERFTARKLFGQSDKRYDKEYWAKLERNWRRWKGGKKRG